MSRIKERKIGEDGQLVGYLLERDGLDFMVSMRDLYDEALVEELIGSGYKYHDYYGDIDNEAGIPLSELSSSVVSPEDNMSFYSCFEQSALTEQQMLQYMSINMRNVDTVEFKEPVKIIIHNREELIDYLNNFKYIQQRVTTMTDIVPLNAICDRKALFTVDELAEDSNIKELIPLINRRRTFVNRKTLENTKNFFKEYGLLNEDNWDDIDSFVEAWFAWGPEGINTKCIQSRIIRDVIFPCDVLYTGTGQEELTLESRYASIQQAVTLSSLEGIPVKYGYGIIDRKGNVNYCGRVITPNDIISNMGDVLLRDEVQQKYNEYRRNVNNWKSPYMPIQTVELIHRNRLCFTLQSENGQVFMYRADPEMISLVDSRRRVISSVFARVKLENGSFVKFNDGFSKNVIIEQIVFRRLAKEIMSDITVKPLNKSTVDMCEKFGLTYEQIIDYIEYIRGNENASDVLHGSLPEFFYDVFGEGLDTLSEEASLTDRLEIFMENLDKMTDPNSPQYVDFAGIMTDMSKINTPIWNAAVYLENDKPMAKFNAILDFNENTTSGEQLAGRSNDSVDSLVSMMITLIKSCYMLNHSKYEVNDVIQEIIKIKNKQYFDISDITSPFSREYIGNIKDIGNLVMAQLSTAEYSVWAYGVVNEISGAPVSERRHLAFFGVKMNMSKGSGIRNIINSMCNYVDIELKRDNYYYNDNSRNICGRFYKSYILSMIWSIRNKNAMVKQKENGDVYVTLTCTDEILRKHEFNLVMKSSEYNYIVNPACEDFTPFVTSLYDWCRYSMTFNYGAINFYCIAENVTVNPWFVKAKDKYNDIPVYNGAINIIATDAWNTVYKNGKPEQYNEVMKCYARAPICIGDSRIPLLFPSINNVQVDAEVFAEENRRLGLTGNSLPPTMIDYYLDNSKSESFQDYYKRAIYCSKQALKEGKKLLYIPLKSDIYYSEISKLYGYYTTQEPVYSVDGDIPSRLFGVTLTRNAAMVSISSNQARIVRFQKYDFTSEDFIQCAVLANGEFECKEACYISASTIVRMNGQRLSSSKITINDMHNLVDDGIACQVNANTFIIYAVNGTFVVEV